jgi:Flp pilus assembly protein TadB
MTALQLAITFGCLVGLGTSLIVLRLIPAQAHLGDALNRLSPSRIQIAEDAAINIESTEDRVGIWVQRHLPIAAYIKIPTRELAMLRIPVYRYLGQKALYFTLGLMFPTTTTVIVSLAGMHLPYIFPVAGGLILAIALSFIPDITARTEATKARHEFVFALRGYYEFVALERHAGSGTNQSMENAAQVGDSWVFQRLQEELRRASLAGTMPWDALTELAEELDLPELADLGDIMRLSGEEGATVYETLRARGASIGNAILTREHEKANAAGERMTMPVSLLALIFLALLAAPGLLKIVNG